MKNALLGLALVVGTTIAFVSPVPGQDGAPPQDGKGGGKGKGGFGRGGGKAPAEPAGPMPKLPDGHPDMQGFWTPPAITDIEPAQGRGGRGGGAPKAAPAPPANPNLAATGFGAGGGGNRIVDPADGKVPYKPEARAK